ncbi:glycine hydroxymethyltransferase [Parachlamydia sp. AcF125]|uniref:glycine hydroxymethyltransferase n=1 Tax=Parachlamydia sp. AcF125 TaxID=2795736 RepID=UPI001BC8F995|nr:glycine hydroxymethyltransferase [Parachlamydia sp. AcF125]MBS4168186.1 Serine hydroxymethyltransferase [Parachlamydia sp. AcF125]
MQRIKKYLQKHSQNLQPAAIAYLAALDHIEICTPQIAHAIEQELRDQRSHLKLIASENYSSLAVQLAMGNLLTDKYAEGFPHHRFYAGCENVDFIEEMAQEELKQIFGADHAYVQPHSGADANLVAFWSILVQRVQNKEIERLGKKTLDELTAEEYEQIRKLMNQQKLMGMSLSSGGHLTHGYRHNLSSKMMRAVFYEVDPQTEQLDYQKLAQQVQKEKPDILLAGYSAYSRKINFAKMREIADTVGAVFMVDMAHFSGLVAGKVFQGEYNPVPYAHIVTSTTHKTLRGPRGGFVLCKAEFADTVNKGCPLALGGPLPHVIAAKAIAFKEANSPSFRNYAQRIVNNAQTLAEKLKAEGGRIVSGATENHLVILDLSSFGLTGRHAESILRKAGLTVNRNTIPGDQNGPWYTSGIRLGTPATTTLGMGTDEMTEIASIILHVLKNTKPAIVEKTGQSSKANAQIDPKVLEEAQSRVKSLLAKFPLYPEIEI